MIFRDWGPAFPTIGIDKPLRLVFYDYRVANVVLRQTINMEKNEAVIFVDVTFAGKVPDVIMPKVASPPSMTMSKAFISF